MLADNSNQLAINVAGRSCLIMEPVTFLCVFQVSAGEARAKSFIYGFVGLFLFLFYFSWAFLAFQELWHAARADCHLGFFFLFFFL